MNYRTAIEWTMLLQEKKALFVQMWNESLNIRNDKSKNKGHTANSINIFQSSSFGASPDPLLMSQETLDKLCHFSGLR